MSSFPILDFVLGMVFIYLLLSIICSSAVELWLTIRRTRARLLSKWLKTIFNLQALDPHAIPIIDRNGMPVSVGQAIIDHCMIIALSPKGKSNSYLGDENFTTALLDKISITEDAPKEFGFIPPPQNLEIYIEQIKKTKVISAELQRTILMFAYESKKSKIESGSTTPAGAAAMLQLQGKSEIDDFRDRLKKWYNLNQDRLTGNLKRKALPATIIMAVLVTIGLNVNSIAIGKYLYHGKEDAANFVELANHVGQTQLPTSKQNLTLNREFPWGWNERTKYDNNFFGWLATILAIIMGAPLWFELLNKIVNIRNTGPKPLEMDEKKSVNKP